MGHDLEKITHHGMKAWWRTGFFLLQHECEVTSHIESQMGAVLQQNTLAPQHPGTVLKVSQPPKSET